jgi:hypothetical protein
MSPVQCPVCCQWKKSLTKHLAWSPSCSEAFVNGSSHLNLMEGEPFVPHIDNQSCMEDDSSSFFGQHTFGSPSFECYEQDNILLDSNVNHYWRKMGMGTMIVPIMK